MQGFLYGMGWVLFFAGLWYVFNRWVVRPDAPRTAPAGGPANRTAPDTHSATTRTDGAPPPAYQRSAAGDLSADHAKIIAAAGLVLPDPTLPAGSSRAAGEGLDASTEPWDPQSLFTTTPPEERGHTGIGARSGDGKTQTSIALMVQDIARGAQVFWLNPQYTYYHPKDQPIDLHPIKHLFTVVSGYGEILALLRAAYKLGVSRQPLYRAGKDVGHNVCIYLDEWPAIYAELGDEAAEAVQRILRELRKTNIWITLAAQDFLKDTTGFSSGVRTNFTTCLVGNVDDTTWRALLGGGIPKQPVRKGTWMTPRGLAEVVRPSEALIANMAQLPARNFPALVSSVVAPAAPVVAKEDPTLLRLFAQVDAQKTRTGSPAGDGPKNAENPAPEPVRTGTEPGDLAHSEAQEPVRADLPTDTQSRAIRALVQEGISRNNIIDLLHLPGNKAAGLKRIKQALGEAEDSNANA